MGNALADVLNELVNYAVPEERQDDLRKQIAAVVADTDDEGVTDFTAGEAKELIEGQDDVDTLKKWRDIEEGSKDRSTVIAAIDNRIEEIESANNDN